MQNRRIYIIAIVVLVLITITLLFRNNNNRTNWRETYSDESDQPYGTEFFFKLLRLSYDRKVTVLNDKLSEDLPIKKGEMANFVFVGAGFGVDSADINQLLEFAENGSSVFIASKAVPRRFFEALFSNEYPCSHEWSGYSNIFSTKEVGFSFEHPSLQGRDATLLRQFYGDTSLYSWNYIDETFLCGNLAGGLLPLGYLNDTLSNFVRWRYGKGTVYLHTNPLVFTNISLLEEHRLNYVKGVLSHLPKGRIYWDSYNNVPESAVNPRSSSRLNRENPLQYILSQPALTWAWYILIGLGVVYLIFRSKRRQRIIPITEKNENTSLEFLATIGRLHFLRNSHKYLAQEKSKLFLSFIRRRYQIQGQDLDDKAVDRLVAKSQIEKDKIRKLLVLINNIESSSFVSENTLISYHKALDEFYKNCK